MFDKEFQSGFYTKEILKIVDITSRDRFSSFAPAFVSIRESVIESAGSLADVSRGRVPKGRVGPLTLCPKPFFIYSRRASVSIRSSVTRSDPLTTLRTWGGCPKGKGRVGLLTLRPRPFSIAQ